MSGELSPVSLVIGGAAVPLNDVLADVTVRHGRVDVYDQASPSALQATVQGVSRAYTHAFRTGQTCVFNCTDGATTAPRFTGTITDASLDDDRLTVIAVGNLSTLARYTVGTVDYPGETWSARLSRVFGEAGISSMLQLVAPPQDPMLYSRLTADAGPVTLADYLVALAEMIGAAVADTPDGKILVQPISARTLASEVVLDPNEVAYVPAWVQVLPLSNQVTVTYKPTGEVTANDTASQATYGVRPLTIETEFSSSADATARANERLARSAFPHWNIPSAPLLVGRRLAIGAPLELVDMPPASPYAVWTPVLEGWQDSIVGDGHELDWTMELALSDPLASGLTLPWNAVPTTAGYAWNTIDQTVAWQAALTLDDLEA